MNKIALIIGALFSAKAFANADVAMDLYLNQQYDQAFKLFQQTASLGHAKSQFNLGVQYLRGQGVQEDPVMAYGYLSLAIENGFTMAKQAQKTVERKLSAAQLTKAKQQAQQLIALYGPTGSENITQALAYGRTYNPPPRRSENPEIEYPSEFFASGMPGIASYTFEIDKNGKVRDLIKLQSYPSDEFGESVINKLNKSRYEVLKIGGTMRKFSNAQFKSVFSRKDAPPETIAQLDVKRKQLLSKAKSGDSNAQAELANLLEVLQQDEPAHQVYFPVERVKAGANAPEVVLKQDKFDGYKPIDGVTEPYQNIEQLVWFDGEGKLVKSEPFNQSKAHPALLKLIEQYKTNWQVVFSKPAHAEINGPYLAQFYFNNEARNPQIANYIHRTKVRVKSIVNRPDEENPLYWRLKAAQGGHNETLMLLGYNCNLKLLSVAAGRGHVPAQVQAAKCIFDLVDASKEQQVLAVNWLKQAVDKGDLIAMRELAGYYVRTSNNKGLLEQAMQLAEKVADENDDPWAYEYLAGAYAKLGKFEEAIDYQEKAINEAEDADYYLEDAQLRLSQYQNSKLATW